jgi:hypothetical protein
MVMDYTGLGKYMGLGAFFGAMLAVAIIIGLALYIYTAFAWMTIAKKLGYNKPWLAWIPIANLAMIFQLGGFHWAWVFLILIPILGWIALFVLLIMSTWKIYEKRKYPGWLSLASVVGVIPFIGWIGGLAQLIIIGMVAWSDKK